MKQQILNVIAFTLVCTFIIGIYITSSKISVVTAEELADSFYIGYSEGTSNVLSNLEGNYELDSLNYEFKRRADSINFEIYTHFR